jgi:hypothetical protein
MKPIEKKLVKLFNRLGAPERDMLLGFAEYLVQRSTADTAEDSTAIPEPKSIPRPQEESVVAAIKRLSKTYHMLDDNRLLNDTSMLMSQHVMQGRDAVEVIDELEALFQRYYEELLGEFTGAPEDSAGC